MSDRILRTLYRSGWLSWQAFRWLLPVVLCGVVHAEQPLMSESKASALRSCFPQSRDRDLLHLMQRPDLIFYTPDEMPAAYQANQGELTGAAGNALPAVRFASTPIAANFDPVAAKKGLNGHVGNANMEFPWRHAAGTDHVRNLRTFRFVALPRNPSGGRWPIAVWKATLPNDSGPVYQWTFPEGAIVAEVLCMRGPDGNDYCWEIRTREKGKTFWEPQVWRPFETPEHLAAAIAEVRPGKKLPKLGPLRRFVFNDDQPLRAVIRQVAGMDYLPPLNDDQLVSELLTRADFKNVHGQPWRAEGDLVSHAPSTKAPWHIVPADYQGCAIEVSAMSCARCHETASNHSETFARNINVQRAPFRDWYGRIKGSDSVLSFHPFDLQSIGAGRQVRLRRELISAGVVALYDPKKHPANVYRTIDEFDARKSPKPPANIRFTR